MLAATSIALWLLFVESWFQGPLLGVHGRLLAPVAGLALLALAASRVPTAWRAVRRHERLALLVLAAVVLGTLVRLPALAAPAGLISSDSAVGGIMAQEVAWGLRPAPIYAPGFPYEGTLKVHLTALLASLAPGAGWAFAYALASHLFFLLWTAATMVLAWRAGGLVAAAAVGAFFAVSPRFLAAFCLNNVGQYPEMNALGALTLALLASSAPASLVGFVLGLGLWQQMVSVYFVAVVALAHLATPVLRHPRALAATLAGTLAGVYPVLIWNAQNAWSTLDLFRRGGKNPLDRITGIPERLDTVARVSVPKLLGLSDVGAPELAGVAASLAILVLVGVMTWRRRHEIRAQRGRHPVALAVALLLVVVLVFAASKFSHRGARRPRYLMPTYTALAVLGGVAAAGVARRSRPAAAVGVLAVVGLNGAGLRPWLEARLAAHRRDTAIVEQLVRLGVRNGYAGFWVGPKYTFLSDGRFVLSGELGPDVSWVYLPYVSRVRRAGADALIVPGDLAQALDARLTTLGVTATRSHLGADLVAFTSFSRQPYLEQLEGYDLEVPRADRQPVRDEEDDVSD